MSKKTVSLQEYKEVRNDKSISSTINNLIPLIIDEKQRQIEPLNAKLKRNRRRLEEIRKKYDLSRTLFYKIPQADLRLYLKLKTENFMIECAIINIQSLVNIKELV